MTVFKVCTYSVHTEDVFCLWPSTRWCKCARVKPTYPASHWLHWKEYTTYCLQLPVFSHVFEGSMSGEVWFQANIIATFLLYSPCRVPVAFVWQSHTSKLLGMRIMTDKSFESLWNEDSLFTKPHAVRMSGPFDKFIRKYKKLAKFGPTNVGTYWLRLYTSSYVFCPLITDRIVHELTANTC